MSTTSSHSAAARPNPGIAAFDRYPDLLLVNGPVHANWLSQIEVYFSVPQHKPLTPSDFVSLNEIAVRSRSFEIRYGAIVNPFDWTFTR